MIARGSGHGGKCDRLRSVRDGGAPYAFTLPHASIPSVVDPQRQVDVAQSESLVQDLQALLRAGRCDGSAFRYEVEPTCVVRGVATADVSTIDSRADSFAVASRLSDEWRRLRENATWEREYPLVATRG